MSVTTLALLLAAAQHGGHAGHAMPPPRPAATPAARPKPAAKRAAPTPRRARAATGAQRPAAPHAGHAMPEPRAGDAAPAEVPRAADPHAGHGTTATDPHAGHAMPRPRAGDATPAKMPGAPNRHAGHGTIADGPHAGHATSPTADDPHAGHDMGSMSGDVHAGHAMEHGSGGTALTPGNAPAPAVPADHAADAVWDPGAMAHARHRMMVQEGGGQRFAQAIVNIAEVQPRRGRDGYRWDGEAWWGGDIHRLALKSEGEGRFGERADDAEVQALYSRAIGPYFNAQGGVRQDLTGARRTHAVLGVEGLAPYWFDVEATAFLSTEGELRARLEGYYDQRITQRLIAQPRAELNLAAQDVAADRIGRGVTEAELGLRLRYELRRELAPYLGVSWERRLGRTARFARAAGEDRGGAAVVAGVRFWF